MLERIYKIFGDSLPEQHIFHATKGAPTKRGIRNEFGSWVEFKNAYLRYVAYQKATVQEEVKAKVAKKVVNSVDKEEVSEEKSTD